MEIIRHLEANGMEVLQRKTYEWFLWKGKYFETDFSKKLNELSI